MQAALQKWGALAFRDFKTESPELFAKLANCPGEESVLENLASELCNYLVSLDNNSIVHFPIGSPFLMGKCHVKVAEAGIPIKIIYSHSERNVVNNSDGTKTVKFEFVRFLEF